MKRECVCIMKKKWDKLGLCNKHGTKTGLPVSHLVSHLKNHGLAVKITDGLDFGVKNIWIEKGKRGQAKSFLRSIGVTVGITLKW